MMRAVTSDPPPFGHLEPTGHGQQVEVVAPTHCRNGDPLGPNQVVVSSVACRCDLARFGWHNSWRCVACGDVQYGPGEHDDTLLVVSQPPRL